MNAVMEFPIVLTQPGTSRPCATCDVRRASICDAIPEADLARLAAAAIGGIARPGALFIEESGPATAFFNIISGTARLYKMLPDGRRQITGFATGGDFLGLAATDLHAVSAEAIDTVRYCRFPHARLHTLMHDYPAPRKATAEIRRRRTGRRSGTDTATGSQERAGTSGVFPDGKKPSEFQPPSIGDTFLSADGQRRYRGLPWYDHRNRRSHVEKVA